MGASRWEASADIRRSAVRLAMTPTLNSMNVMGVVSIPGMMTGQILGGTAPAQVRRVCRCPCSNAEWCRDQASRTLLRRKCQRQ